MNFPHPWSEKLSQVTAKLYHITLHGIYLDIGKQRTRSGDRCV